MQAKRGFLIEILPSSLENSVVHMLCAIHCCSIHFDLIKDKPLEGRHLKVFIVTVFLKIQTTAVKSGQSRDDFNTV